MVYLYGYGYSNGFTGYSRGIKGDKGRGLFCIFSAEGANLTYVGDALFPLRDDQQQERRRDCTHYTNTTPFLISGYTQKRKNTSTKLRTLL